MSDGDHTSYRAAIFTAIPVEYQAVCAHLTNLREEKTIPETACERGEFSANNRKWDVIIVETGAGTTQAARETILIIERFKPIVVVFVGIAGGVKDVKIGDVVVASKVYNYEGGKSDPFFQSRPQAYSPTRRIQQRAVAVSRKKDWLRRLTEHFANPSETPNVIVAPIASGNQVVASTKAAVLQLLRSHFNDAIAVEMEGFGFLESARLYQEIDALIIRGISDLIDDKSEPGNQQFQLVAAKRASAFAFEVLANLEIEAWSAKKEEPIAVPEQPQQVDNIPSQETDQAEEKQPLSLLEEFNRSLPDYIDKVKTMRDSLNLRTGFSSEQHRNALKVLDDMEKHIKTLLDAEALSHMISRRALLAAMQTRIRDLRPELEKCR
ncbi:MAG TPA: 5'-methylthioadenosine/S-adenosylhomocysteine nucleosidase, partial [Ktedonobacteraceae bacterium]|nr:5'-methylthioadenosine/S-adenosylhomocysteine nucleosidase [Ktedonobacteraceae bacterium]